MSDLALAGATQLNDTVDAVLAGSIGTLRALEDAGAAAGKGAVNTAAVALLGVIGTLDVTADTGIDALEKVAKELAKALRAATEGAADAIPTPV